MEQPKMLRKQIDLNQTTPISCDKCKGEAFQQSLMLRKVSALLTGTGDPGIIPIQVFVCAACGNVNEEFKPDELKSGIISK